MLEELKHGLLYGRAPHRLVPAPELGVVVLLLDAAVQVVAKLQLGLPTPPLPLTHVEEDGARELQLAVLQVLLGHIDRLHLDKPARLGHVDDEVEAGEEFGAVESVKAASDLNSPVSGVVVEVNEALEDEPELLNKDAFANWIIKVSLSDKSELDNLMDAKAYEEFCANE